MWSTILISLSPLFTFALASWIHRRQNSKKAWTGGPISKPKSHWLAWTIFNWFLVPVFFLFHPQFPESLTYFFIFHLISWWIRGPLELIMIYRWLNWSPIYGISHDLFHIIVGALLLIKGWPEHAFSLWDFSDATLIFALLILITTAFEISFAALFLKTRSSEERNDHIYFASNDPKWIFINRLTRMAVMLSYSWMVVISLLVFS